MHDYKYLVDEYGGLLIFPPYVVHSDVARQCPHGIVGAGFVSISEGKVCCYGRSHSLRIDSRGKMDSLFLANFLGLDAES